VARSLVDHHLGLTLSRLVRMDSRVPENGAAYWSSAPGGDRSPVTEHLTVAQRPIVKPGQEHPPFRTGFVAFRIPRVDHEQVRLDPGEALDVGVDSNRESWAVR